VDCDFGRAFGVASSFEGLDEDGTPDGFSFWKGPRDDQVHGREGKSNAGPDPVRQVQHQPVLLQHPGLEPVLGRQEMALWHPCQRPSGPLQQGAYLGVLLHRELPLDGEGQLRPVVGAPDQPLLVLDGAPASQFPSLGGRGLLCGDAPTIS